MYIYLGAHIVREKCGGPSCERPSLHWVPHRRVTLDYDRDRIVSKISEQSCSKLNVVQEGGKIGIGTPSQ